MQPSSSPRSISAWSSSCVIPGLSPELQQPTHPGGVRPGAEAATAPPCALGDPDLLETRPMVGRSLPQKEGRRVRLLELEVHLEAAVVAVAGIRSPGALAPVDALPGAQVRRVERNPPDDGGAATPPVEHVQAEPVVVPPP